VLIRRSTLVLSGVAALVYLLGALLWSPVLAACGGATAFVSLAGFLVTGWSGVAHAVRWPLLVALVLLVAVAATTGLWLAEPPTEVGWFAYMPAGPVDNPLLRSAIAGIVRLRLIGLGLLLAGGCILVAALRRRGRWSSGWAVIGSIAIAALIGLLVGLWLWWMTAYYDWIGRGAAFVDVFKAGWAPALALLVMAIAAVLAGWRVGWRGAAGGLLLTVPAAFVLGSLAQMRLLVVLLDPEPAGSGNVAAPMLVSGDFEPGVNVAAALVAATLVAGAALVVFALARAQPDDGAAPQ
jgi:hypothetical protein